MSIYKILESCEFLHVAANTVSNGLRISKCINQVEGTLDMLVEHYGRSGTVFKTSFMAGVRWTQTIRQHIRISRLK